MSKKSANAFPYVEDSCIYCGICAKKCPVKAIEVDRNTKSWTLDKAVCLQCGLCAMNCPKKIIDFDTYAVEKPPIHVTPSKGKLCVDPQLCSGCMSCMYACTLSKDGLICLDLARIQLNHWDFYAFDISAQPCLQCDDPQCMRFCPVGAITIEEKTGARVINEDKCIGCMSCIHHCPYKPARIAFDSIKMKATKCDLCQGDPQCVKACPSGALTYITNSECIQTDSAELKGRDQI